MRVGATPKCQAVHSGAGAQTCSGRGVRKAERRSAAGRRKGPEAVTELVRNGTGRHTSRTMLFPLPGDAIPRQTRSTLLAVRPRDKEPHLAPGIACLPLGVVTLKSAQQGRDSVCFTVPKKALHRRSSDSHSIRAITRLNLCRRRGGSPVDFLRHEALVRVAVSTHGDQLAHPASARGIAFAVENKIHCLSGL